MRISIRRACALLIAALILGGCASLNIPRTGAANSPAGSAPSAKAASPTTASNNAASGAAVQYSIVADKSSANYRVREQLARLNFPSDAVGKTSQISGTIAIRPDGTFDPSSKVTVDLTSLKSDANMRDNFVRRNVLMTDQYPTAVFVPTRLTGLPWPLPQSGKVSFQVSGNLTIQNTTKPVTWDVTGTVNGDTATGYAKTSFKFEDFNLEQPHVPVVLSVADSITLEANLTLQRVNP